MQISPAYDSATPVLAIEGLGDPTAALTRQRRRLLDVVRGLSGEQWDAPSRCEKWSVKDVVSHLAGTDRFWGLMFAASIKGEPTRFLTNFDPVATPEQMVDGLRAVPPTDVLSQFERNLDALISTLGTVTDWSMPAECPLGHVAMNVAALHALWDAWIHERDILLPLGLWPVEDAEEITLILQYVAALSPAFSVSHGRTARATLSVVATDPDVALSVEVGERVVVRPDMVGEGPRLAGPAVALIEGLSHRGPLPSDLAPGDQWLLLGLAEVFDQA